MTLPSSYILPIEKLAAIFNNTTNSYKFYWFLSLLENLKIKKSDTILIEDVVIEMIGEVWYPINFFKLSFGKQDQLTNTIHKIQSTFNFPKDLRKHELITNLKARKNEPILKALIKDFSRYVPYRFLSPYYTEELRGTLDTKKNSIIKKLATDSFLYMENPSIYRFTNNSTIEINFLWREYLTKHLGILQSFSYWHLTQYLQKNNPNVPNIPDKLFAPDTRILSNAKKFWETYFDSKEKVSCIYSGELLIKKDFSIDHFLPWSFTAHDQLWNLLPTSKNINSSKGDNLPSEKYLEKFLLLQFDAFRIVSLNAKEKTLEDYSILFNDGISSISKLNKIQFGNTLMNNIKPLMQIAANMGFQTNWQYKSNG